MSILLRCSGKIGTLLVELCVAGTIRKSHVPGDEFAVWLICQLMPARLPTEMESGDVIFPVGPENL